MTQPGSKISLPLRKITPLPKAQLIALCMARLSDPIGYTQIFPYVNEFIASLHVTDDPAKIGFYSGLVESTSSIAKMLTIFHWAKLSDRIGRRPVILAGALGTTLVSSLFGLSRSFPQILALRAITGLSVGNSSVYQTILAELTDTTNRASAYPIYGGIYPLGATVGPLIGGFFSNLATKYPTYFGYSFLEAHPSRTMGILELLSIPNIGILSASSSALAFSDVGFSVVWALFCFTPIETGGLGFSATQIGYTLSMSSGFFAFFQLLLMPILMRKFSIAKMYMFFMGVWPITFMLVPLLNAIARMGQNNRGANTSYFNFDILLWIGTAVVIICWRVACLAYSCMGWNNAILVRNNCPSPSSLGSANGLNVLSMPVSGCTSPAFVSTLFALSVDKHLLGGHLWVGVMATISGLGFWTSTRVLRDGS
ncbi:major facilitator superfamily domain-containing protein [Mycena vulgaris]|nr:major facilitator superfamily domain-containing protein [Mycena vulgaris]